MDRPPEVKTVRWRMDWTDQHGPHMGAYYPEAIVREDFAKFTAQPTTKTARLYREEVTITIEQEYACPPKTA